MTRMFSRLHFLTIVFCFVSVSLSQAQDPSSVPPESYSEKGECACQACEENQEANDYLFDVILGTKTLPSCSELPPFPETAQPVAAPVCATCPQDSCAACAKLPQSPVAMTASANTPSHPNMMPCPASCESCPDCATASMPVFSELSSEVFASPPQADWTLPPGFVQNPNFVQNDFCQPPVSQQQRVALSLATCLADPNLSTESRQAILEMTMDLVVRNAELEARIEIAQLQLEHERELAVMRGNLLQMQAQLSATGEIENWMTPMYANLNQTQQQFENLSTNLQLIHRTLGLLEKERALPGQVDSRNRPESRDRMLTQPRPGYPRGVESKTETPYPERWSRLPSHSHPQPLPTFNDKSTRNQPPARTSDFKTTSRPAPPRLTEQEVQQERIEAEINRLRNELKTYDHPNPIRPVSWNEPLPSQPLQPMPQPLQPRR